MMNAILNTLIKAFFIIIIVLMTSKTVKAQFGIGGPGTNGSGINGNCTSLGAPHPAVPFDGGMNLVLLASGIGYGQKEFTKSIKPNKKIINAFPTFL